MISAQRVAQRGFTLIEVLIASAIVVASMGLLLQLFGSGLDRLNRISYGANLIIAEKEVVNRLSTINPALIAEGEGIAEGIRYHWRATQITPFGAVSPDLGEVPFQRHIALFAIDVEFLQSNGQKSSLELERLGWKGSS